MGSFHAATGQLIQISRCDRWQVYHRLQQLSIPCDCLEDGCLRVTLDSPVHLLQLRSVLQHTRASRQELIPWLERCWNMG